MFIHLNRIHLSFDKTSLFYLFKKQYWKIVIFLQNMIKISTCFQFINLGLLNQSKSLSYWKFCLIISIILLYHLGLWFFLMELVASTIIIDLKCSSNIVFITNYMNYDVKRNKWLIYEFQSLVPVVFIGFLMDKTLSMITQ